MFKSKAEVDKHVGRILNRLKSQAEINRECLKIARFYFDINEYESAKVYLVNYLSDNIQDAAAWELMGDLVELNEKNWPEAIKNYTECLKLSETQNKKVLLKICKCYLNLDEKKLIDSVKTARKWLEKTETYYPFDKTVIELKEKLIKHLIESINSGSASVTSSPSDPAKTFNSRECMLLKDEWESFLLKALEQSPADKNLNLKLIKAYLAFKQPGQQNIASNVYLLKAIKKILVNELNCTFNENSISTAIQYYQTLLSIVQSEQDKIEPFGYLNAIEMLLLKQSLLIHLKSQDTPDSRFLLKSMFIKYNRSVYEMEAYLRQSSDEVFRHLVDEHKSFIYYLTGLLLLRQDWSDTCSEDEKCLLKRMFNGSDSDDLNPDEILSNEERGLLMKNNQILASICFIVSLNKNKPSAESTARVEQALAKAKQLPELASVSSLFAKCVNRDASWRYSVISHWLKFKLKSNKDKLCFFNNLCELTADDGLVKDMVYQKLGLLDKNQENDKIVRSSILSNLDEFRLSKNQLVSFDASTIYSIVDQKSLEYSNKVILTNQNSNLAYLVWFNVSNAIQKHSNLISAMDKSIKNTLIFPYFVLNHSSQKSTKKIQYGVENLNLCNTESLSLIDMKLFIYSSALQACSYLNDDLMPYWIQPNLCSPYQFNWWFRAVDYLFKPFTAKRNEQQLCLNKLIELVRLKSNTIQLSEGDLEAEPEQEQHAAPGNSKASGKPELYKQNLIITIKLALYLQYLVNSLTNKFKSTKIKYTNLVGGEDASASSAAAVGFLGAGNMLAENTLDDTSDESLLLDSLMSNECELEYSPQQKLDYLKRYQLQYWTFVSKELVKLKQIRGACSDDDNLDEVASTCLFALSEYDFDNDNPAGLHQKAKNYFNYSHRHLNEPSNQHIAHLNENLLIQTALLELILDNVHKFQLGTAGEESFEQDFQGVKTNLEAALARFELIDVNLGDTDLNYYQLQLCKKIGEESVRQRDNFAKLIEATKASDAAKCLGFSELLNKVKCLIEYLKTKFNKNFVNKKAQICSEHNDQLHILNKFEILKNFGENDAHALCNLSISEWLKQNDPLSQLDDFEEMNKEKMELNEIKELDETEAEAEEAREPPKEFAEPRSPSFSDLRTPMRPEGLISTRQVQEAENAFDDVDLDKSFGNMVAPTRIDFESDVLPEPKPVVVVEADKPIQTITEDRQVADALNTQTIAEIKQTNDKITQLIKTFTTERTEQRFRFNRDILKEQFVTVNFQYSQMNQEIKSLSQVCANRKKILTDFRQLVDAMNVMYDIEAFNQQFKIYFWLFQNQPNYIEEFMRSQCAKQADELNQQAADSFTASLDQTPKKAGSAYDESYEETLESNKTLGTSFNASRQSVVVEPKAASVNESPKPVTEKSSVLNQTDQSASLNDHYGTPQQTNGSIIASFSDDPKSPQNTSQMFLSKPIGELNFKSNDNLIEQMKNSINLYKLDKQASEEICENDDYVLGLGLNDMEDYNFEDEYQNEYDYCGDAIVAGNLRRSEGLSQFDPNDQEDGDGTFLSCSNNNTNKADESNQPSHGLSKSASGSNSKSSISELNILFQNACQVFECHFEANQPSAAFAEKDFRWTSKNKCTVQIIGDEISDRDNFQAYMFISEPNDGKTVQYDLHLGIHLKKFGAEASKSGQHSCFLYSSASLNELKSKTIAFEFESEALLNEFESSIAELKAKLSKHSKLLLQPNAPAGGFDSYASVIAKKAPACLSAEKPSPLKQLFNLTQSL